MEERRGKREEECSRGVPEEFEEVQSSSRGAPEQLQSRSRADPEELQSRGVNIARSRRRCDAKSAQSVELSSKTGGAMRVSRGALHAGKGCASNWRGRP